MTDVNGTLAVDGELIDGLAERISSLRKRLEVHMLTADTHGHQAVIDKQLDLSATIVTPGNESQQKADFVRRLGADTVVALGQGANDAAMLMAAGLGVCVLSQEGLAAETLMCADLVVPDVHTFFDLMDKPMRVVASLRK
ncbi:MAG: HAD family hydrolase [Anaerolineales bacterium]|nr:HAD family hydrolase [Anaerolineales bacterium]